LGRKRIVVLAAAAFVAGGALAPVGTAVAKTVTDVFITNTAANPVPVAELNSVATRPFHRFGAAQFEPTQPNAVLDLYTVPEGQRVVITYVGVDVQLPLDQDAVAHVRTAAGDKHAVLSLTDAGTFPLFEASHFLTGGGPISAVFSPGDHIVVTGFRNGGIGIGNLQATITGYTVPIP
jgi:hypothetical protein